MKSTDWTNIPTGTATGIVDPPSVGLDHLDQKPDDAARRVKLAAFPALGTGELGKEVLVDTTENIPRHGIAVDQVNRRKEVQQFP